MICIPPPALRVRGLAATDCIWPQDADAPAGVWRQVHVRFLDGERGVWRRVAAIVNAGWNAACGLQFVFDQSPEAEIRVTFAPGASWSYMGTVATYLTQAEPTMQLGWVNAESGETETRRVVLHEFGHALGLEHEQKFPNLRIPWDYPALYAHFKATQGWDAETVNRQVLAPLEAARYTTTSYDPASVMHYAIPAELLTDPGWAVGWNMDLSAGDREMVRKLYGPPPVQPEPEVPEPVPDDDWQTWLPHVET